MTKQTYVIETVFSLKYTTHDPVSIPEIIKSLQSTEKLLKRTPAFIEKAFHGIKVNDVEVYVEHLETGSLKTDFIVKYVIGADNAEQLKIIWNDIVSNNQPLKLIVAAGMGAMVTYGVLNTMSPTQATTHIEAYEGSTVIVGSEVGLSGDDVSKILDKIPDKKQLAKEAIDFIKPARADGQATIEMSGIPELTIDHGFVDEAPAEYTPPTPEEKSESFTNVPISVFASDKDKTDSGWAGIVPGVVDKRVKFVLDVGVDPAKLHGNTALKADIEVQSRFIKARNKYEVNQVLIKRTN